jgi:low temperature requirement protein LtrA
MHQLLTALRLRSIATAEARKVTWLELFFDLIFVAAVAQVAAPLRTEYSIDGLIRFAPLFVLIWSAWTGQSLFSTRFDSDDAIQRGLTLLQMFAVAAMAANAKDALDSRSSAGFAAAYAAVRMILVAQYLRAREVPGARPLTTRYVAGHGSAALLWLASAFVPAPGRFVIWAIAFGIDLGTPWAAVPHSVRLPPDASHLPERFGLFTLILLGESVVAVMHGMESQEDWTPAAAICAFLGMGISFLIWSWYFDGVAGAGEQHVRNRRDALRVHVWSYAHVPQALGIIVTGVGVQRTVTASTRHGLAMEESRILVSAAALVMLSMVIIGATSGRRNRPGPVRLLPHLVIAAGMVGAAFVGVTEPVGVIGLVAMACVAQLVLSLAERRVALQM